MYTGKIENGLMKKFLSLMCYLDTKIAEYMAAGQLDRKDAVL
jgi:hypothetical protein